MESPGIIDLSSSSDDSVIVVDIPSENPELTSITVPGTEGSERGDVSGQEHSSTKEAINVIEQLLKELDAPSACQSLSDSGPPLSVTQPQSRSSVTDDVVPAGPSVHKESEGSSRPRKRKYPLEWSQEMASTSQAREGMSNVWAPGASISAEAKDLSTSPAKQQKSTSWDEAKPGTSRCSAIDGPSLGQESADKTITRSSRHSSSSDDSVIVVDIPSETPELTSITVPGTEGSERGDTSGQVHNITKEAINVIEQLLKHLDAPSACQSLSDSGPPLSVTQPQSRSSVTDDVVPAGPSDHKESEGSSRPRKRKCPSEWAQEMASTSQAREGMSNVGAPEASISAEAKDLPTSPAKQQKSTSWDEAKPGTSRCSAIGGPSLGQESEDKTITRSSRHGSSSDDSVIIVDTPSETPELTSIPPGTEGSERSDASGQVHSITKTAINVIEQMLKHLDAPSACQSLSDSGPPLSVTQPQSRSSVTDDVVPAGPSDHKESEGSSRPRKRKCPSEWAQEMASTSHAREGMSNVGAPEARISAEAKDLPTSPAKQQKSTSWDEAKPGTSGCSAIGGPSLGQESEDKTITRSSRHGSSSDDSVFVVEVPSETPELTSITVPGTEGSEGGDASGQEHSSTKEAVNVTILEQMLKDLDAPSACQSLSDSGPPLSVTQPQSRSSVTDDVVPAGPSDHKESEGSSSSSRKRKWPSEWSQEMASTSQAREGMSNVGAPEASINAEAKDLSTSPAKQQKSTSWDEAKPGTSRCSAIGGPSLGQESEDKTITRSSRHGCSSDDSLNVMQVLPGTPQQTSVKVTSTEGSEGGDASGQEHSSTKEAINVAILEQLLKDLDAPNSYQSLSDSGPQLSVTQPQSRSSVTDDVVPAGPSDHKESEGSSSSSRKRKWPSEWSQEMASTSQAREGMSNVWAPEASISAETKNVSTSPAKQQKSTSWDEAKPGTSRCSAIGGPSLGQESADKTIKRSSRHERQPGQHQLSGDESTASTLAWLLPYSHGNLLDDRSSPYDPHTDTQRNTQNTGTGAKRTSRIDPTHRLIPTSESAAPEMVQNKTIRQMLDELMTQYTTGPHILRRILEPRVGRPDETRPLDLSSISASPAIVRQTEPRTVRHGVPRTVSSTPRTHTVTSMTSTTTYVPSILSDFISQSSSAREEPYMSFSEYMLNQPSTSTQRPRSPTAYLPEHLEYQMWPLDDVTSQDNIEEIDTSEVDSWFSNVFLDDVDVQNSSVPDARPPPTIVITPTTTTSPRPPSSSENVELPKKEGEGI